MYKAGNYLEEADFAGKLGVSETKLVIGKTKKTQAKTEYVECKIIPSGVWSEISYDTLPFIGSVVGGKLTIIDTAEKVTTIIIISINNK